VDLTGGSLPFELRVQDQFADKVSKLPLNILDLHANAREFKVAKERTEELFALFKELDEITGWLIKFKLPL
jgi:hypothetical protein